jgi:hypothetical protein
LGGYLVGYDADHRDIGSEDAVIPRIIAGKLSRQFDIADRMRIKGLKPLCVPVELTITKVRRLLALVRRNSLSA